ncbi:MAG: class I SAM-dependent methyltransferase [Phycisphaeraceae bacterium]|nr:class I SAM-dependent methyltransferase [Phycisphaeraceae bacterium]
MSDPAWTQRDLADPHGAADKARRVEAMFAAIAPSYDLNNRVHSLWRDQAWRRAAVRAAAVRPGDLVLDVACGTGDLAIAFAHSPARRVVGVDFTLNMLRVAQRKTSVRAATARERTASRQGGATQQPSPLAAAGRPLPDGRGSLEAIGYIAGDAMRLPVADQCADVVSIAFGIRNVAQPVAAMAEFFRVMRPGGRLVILEFSLPANALLRRLYMAYFNHVLPRTAALIARDRSGAYRYLPRSVSTFIDRPAMMRMMLEAGFVEVTATPLTCGIAVIYRGFKRSLPSRA